MPPGKERGHPPDLDAAILLAVRAHAGQRRKDQRTPYIAHPIGVMRFLSGELGISDPDILCAAALHDVLEDTRVSRNRLTDHFGRRVTRLVEELTVPAEFHGPSVSDAVKTDVLRAAVGRMSWPAVLVKIADRYDNLGDMTNALWGPAKRRNYRAQTRTILQTIRTRMHVTPPRPPLRKLIARGLAAVNARLEP